MPYSEEERLARQEQTRKVNRFIMFAVAGLFLVVVLPSIVVISKIAVDIYIPQAGERAPAFSLANQDGQLVRSSDFEGDWWLVFFYTQNQRPESMLAARSFRDQYRHFKDMKLRVLGVSYDEVAVHHDFVSNLSLDFDLLSDPDGEVIATYGAEPGMKNISNMISYLVDDAGVIRKVYMQIDPVSHAAEVVRDARAMQRGGGVSRPI